MEIFLIIKCSWNYADLQLDDTIQLFHDIIINSLIILSLHLFYLPLRQKSTSHLTSDTVSIDGIWSSRLKLRLSSTFNGLIACTFPVYVISSDLVYSLLIAHVSANTHPLVFRIRLFRTKAAKLFPTFRREACMKIINENWKCPYTH